MALIDYSGQTTDELLALEGEYSALAVVLAFDEALHEKFERALGQESWGDVTYKAMKDAAEDIAAGRAVRGPLTEEELIILAIVSLDREVNNGGYDQLFLNCVELTPMLVKALHRIGREDVAAVTQEAIDSLKIEGPINVDAVSKARDWSNKAQQAKLDECDGRFYAIASTDCSDDGEDIVDVSLWNFIKANRDKIRVP